MDTPIKISIEGGSSMINRTLPLDVLALDVASSWCGSYDILEMGQHFDAYVMTPRPVLLPEIAGLPNRRRFTRLPAKYPAPSVHGNIGEAVAALTAVSALGFDPAGVAHIKGLRGKTPDLLLKTTDTFAQLVGGLAGLALQFPEWIPCEAKCRKLERGIKQATNEAKQQLQAYWSAVPVVEAGFGIVCCYIHSSPQSVQVRILLPEQAVQAALGAILEDKEEN